MNRKWQIYCRTQEGNSWSGVKRTFTLGGRLVSPEIQSGLLLLEILWNLLFPAASSAVDCDLEGTPQVLKKPTGRDSKDNRHVRHPFTGLLYYFELVPGTNTIFPKIYLPVGCGFLRFPKARTHLTVLRRKHCQDDLFISQAVEKFYAHSAVNVESPCTGRSGPGWVAQEISEAL